jgi:undecaprenyl diphosphate synthase
MRLFREHLESQSARCAKEGIRVNVIGRRDRLDPRLVDAIEASERATAHCSGMTLRIAVDYSARDSIAAAASAAPADRDSFGASLSRILHSATRMPDVDLLIRTGREKRLSDFLLWEASYAEIVFLDVMWPDFTSEHLHAALDEFRRRTRRFGAVEPREAIHAAL